MTQISSDCFTVFNDYHYRQGTSFNILATIQVSESFFFFFSMTENPQMKPPQDFTFKGYAWGGESPSNTATQAVIT